MPRLSIIPLGFLAFHILSVLAGNITLELWTDPDNANHQNCLIYIDNLFGCVDGYTGSLGNYCTTKSGGLDCAACLAPDGSWSKPDGDDNPDDFYMREEICSSALVTIFHDGRLRFENSGDPKADYTCQLPVTPYGLTSRLQNGATCDPVNNPYVAPDPCANLPSSVQYQQYEAGLCPAPGR